jgi:signal transduction histidine kinase/CheY-like chemotaxis protein
MPSFQPLLRWFRIEPTLDLQARFYRALCLVVAFFGGLLIPAVNLLQTSLPQDVTVAVAACGAMGLALFAAARRGREYPMLLFLGVLLASDAVWFPNAGSHGSVVFYLPAVALLPVVFFDDWRRVACVVLILFNYAALLALESAFPGWVRPYASSWERSFDLVTGFFVSLTASVVVVWIVIAEYRTERQRLQATVSALGNSREMLTRGLQEAAQARAQLATLVDSTDDLVWLVDARDCRLTLFNRAFEEAVRSLGVREVRHGLTPEDVLPKEAASWWRQLHARVLAEGSVTAEIPTSSGGILLLSCHRIEVDGALIGVSVFAKDITDRIRAREDRARLEQHLLQAQKLESLGSLAGGVAHDYNNMLAGIMGHADLLLDSETDPKRRESLRAIVMASTRSGELTKKLLAFARRGKNIAEATDLRELARDSLDMLRPSFHPQVVPVLALDGKWTVDGDPSQLQQVLVNLCINAVEAMPRGGTLSLAVVDRWLDDAEAATRQLVPGAYVELLVADTGVGMDQETAVRAFEPFFSTKDDASSGGTGLGLSTVYGIVQLHHGSVTLASTPGRGTTVSVLMPRGTLARPAQERSASRQSAGGIVLVVDDEELLREFTTAALGRLGYGVLTAPDGEAGVTIFRERHAELEGVLLDLKMPKKNGREAFVEMRGIDPSVPVLICSGYGDNEEAQTLISLGASGLLAKPFKIAELGAQLKALGARPVARS